MTEGEAADWLRVAVREVLQYPSHVLREAAATARRTCTHHAQIIPALIAEADELHAMAQKLATPPPTPRLPAPRENWVTQEAFERITAEKGLELSWCLDRGEIISNGDGTFRLP